MKVKFARSRHNAKQTTFTSPTGARRLKHDGNVVSKSMHNIAQIMTSRPVEVAVARKRLHLKFPSSALQEKLQERTLTYY